jgi:hypothetical protein
MLPSRKHFDDMHTAEARIGSRVGPFERHSPTSVLSSYIDNANLVRPTLLTWCVTALTGRSNVRRDPVTQDAALIRT